MAREPPSLRYQLSGRIGGGGMAEVFEATLVGAEGFARPVAVKRIQPSLSSDATFGQMFVNEARIASLLHHPNIAAVLDFDRDEDGRYFLVMELIRGVDLRQLMDTGLVPPRIAVHIAAEILRGLDYAHELEHAGRRLGIVHRDISPHNVMVSWDGAIKVVDFGIAKAMAETGVSRGGAVKGKVAYMSPEQANAFELDGRTDVFAVGVVLHEMLVGDRLFRGSTEPEILARLLTQPIPHPAELAPHTPLDLDVVVMRMLERDRDARYPTAHAAREALLGTSAISPRAGLELEEVLVARFPAQTRRRRGEAASAPPSVQQVRVMPAGAPTATFPDRPAAPPRALAAAFEAPPRYARNGDVHLAWRALGAGPVDLVVIQGWSFPMSSWVELARTTLLCEELAGLARLILFDKRGVGMSDPVKRAPSLAERMEDARAVLDAAGSSCAVVMGMSEGAPLALLLAATHPTRVAGLILVGGFARMTAAADHPWGWSAARVAALRQYIRTSWGAGATIRAMVPKHASDPDLVRWASTTEQRGASPGAALDLVEMNLLIDARPLVPSVHVPAVVLHQRRDRIIPVGCGRHVADHLPRCRYVEVEGDDHAFMYDGRDVLVREVGAMLDRARRDGAEQRRFLATALAVRYEAAGDVDGDGDGRGDREDRDAIEAVLRGFAATVIAIGGGRLIATFDGPARALRCAAALREALGTRCSLAVHIGEIARDGAAMSGPALDVAAAIVEATGRGDIRVSRVVAELVGAAEHCFSPDGEVASVAVFRAEPLAPGGAAPVAS